MQNEEEPERNKWYHHPRENKSHYSVFVAKGSHRKAITHPSSFFRFISLRFINGCEGGEGKTRGTTVHPRLGRSFPNTVTHQNSLANGHLPGHIERTLFYALLQSLLGSCRVLGGDFIIKYLTCIRDAAE